jgi:hypothetical protein
MRTRTARQRERGAVIVEAAMFTSLFLVLVLGIFEFGYAFRDYLTTANLSRTGARVGSGSGNDTLADYTILQSLKSSSGALSSGQINFIVVFDAGSSNASLASVSATCAAGTAVSGKCNVYKTSDLSRPSSDFGCTSSSPDRYWCPTSRKISASAANGGPPSYLGVYLSVKHTNISGLFGQSKTFKDQTIIRIEPMQP